MKTIPYLNPRVFYTLPCSLPLECFFTNVQEMSNKEVLEKFCSLSRLEDHKTCVLKMKDAQVMLDVIGRTLCLTSNIDMISVAD